MITAQESTEKISDLTPFSSWNAGTPPAGWFSRPLDGEAAAFYHENGFLVLDRVLTAEETDALTAEAARICRNADGRINGVGPAPAHLSDDEVMQKTLCIHFPHKLSPLLHGTYFHGAQEIIRDVEGRFHIDKFPAFQLSVKLLL